MRIFPANLVIRKYKEITEYHFIKYRNTKISLKTGIDILPAPLNISVDLYSGEKYVTSGIANSASLRGMNIACDPSHFVEGNKIQVKYELSADGVPHKHNMTVSIKSLSKNEILVGFCNYDNNMFCAVRDVILHNNTEREEKG